MAVHPGSHLPGVRDVLRAAGHEAVLLARTGSRLYGTSHAESDHDWIAVVAGRTKLSSSSVLKSQQLAILRTGELSSRNNPAAKAEQGSASAEITLVSVTRFLMLIERGTHNMLEALWATKDPAATADQVWLNPASEHAQHLINLRPHAWKMRHSLLTEHHGRTAQHKRNMHTARLALYWLQAAANTHSDPQNYAGFRPTLHGADLALVLACAHDQELAEHLRELARATAVGEDCLAQAHLLAERVRPTGQPT